MRRFALAVLVLALAGCAEKSQPADSTLSEVAEFSAPNPSVDPAPATATSMPPPQRLADVGMSWANCWYLTSAFTYKHEWAADLIPSEYRQANTMAGNLGQATFQVFICEGQVIGNQTFIANNQFGYWAALVEPPASVAGAGPDFYLLDAFSTESLIIDQGVEANLPMSLASSLTWSPGSFYHAETANMDVNVTLVHGNQAHSNSTVQMRLHWWKEGFRCWADVNHLATDLFRAEASMVAGDRGSAGAVTGPLHVLGGLASEGEESGSIGAPSCEVRN